MAGWTTTDWEQEIELIARREQQNAAGLFELTEIRIPNIDYTFPDQHLIEKNLSLVYGIGKVTAQKLVKSGYRTLTDLLQHPHWQKAAAEITRLIAARNVAQLAQYGAADLELLGFFEPGDITFIDIETLGIFYMFPVFLIGVLQFVEGQGVIRQFLARNYQEEAAILAELDDGIRNRGVLVSYNGRSFDVPYLQGRLRLYGMDDRFDAFHLDLLRHTRKNFRNILPDCRLVTVERCLLGDGRVNDLPGSEVPEQYQRYLDSGDRELIEPVLKHNAADLLTMAKYLGLITIKNQKKVAANAD